MPNIDIKKLKKSMVRSNILFQNNRPMNLSPRTVKGTNCYAYSLGIMCPEKKNFYYPGFTKDERYYVKDEEELMRNIRIDLRNLGITFRQIDLDCKKIVLQDDEYLIKVFFTPKNEKYLSGNFHFARMDNRTYKWIHKMGWYRQPEFVHQGNKGAIIGSEPMTFMIQDGCFTYVYNPVAYLVITED